MMFRDEFGDEQIRRDTFDDDHGLESCRRRHPSQDRSEWLRLQAVAEAAVEAQERREATSGLSGRYTVVRFPTRH